MSIEISKETIQKLEGYAQKYKVSIDEVVAKFNKNLEKLQNEKKARIVTVGDLEEEFGNLVTNAPFFYVYVLDDSGIQDIFDMMRSKSYRLYDNAETRQDAIDQGFITMDRIALDYRKNVFGKPNEHKGEPLTGSLFNRTIFCIASTTPDFEQVFVAEIGMNGEDAKTTDSIERWTFYEVRANQGKNRPDRLNLSKGSKFKVHNTIVTPAELANKIMSCEFASLDKEYRDNFAGKKNTNYATILKGDVSWMSLDVFNGSRVFLLFDDDTEKAVKSRISDNIPITFKSGDTLLTFNRLFANRKTGNIDAQVKAYMVI